jgi:transposase
VSGSRGELHFDKIAYRERHLVALTINRLKQFCRVATRYEKREQNHLEMVTISALMPL